jgi:uncharacterized protein YecE (DUF72 family)
MIKTGSCGWGYMRPKDFFGNGWEVKFKSVLQAYASLYPTVEVNSTFYRIPKLTTVEKWRKEASEINKDFEFTVKCTQMVTHKIRFSKGSIRFFDVMKTICKTLNAKILLMQSPSSFKPTDENIERLEDFFENIDRSDLLIAWESRGDWRKQPKLVGKICKKFDLIDCVDILRNEPVWFGKKKVGYFRLHGFGLISMYSYNFSQRELEQVKEKIRKLGKKIKTAYVMFNNANCYQNALQFMKLIEK